MVRWLERWGLPVLRVLFPITTGSLVSGLSVALEARDESYAADVAVSRVLPSAPERVKRMVTIRDDGGPQDGTIQRHGYGFNVWAESSTKAEMLARLCMGILPTLADGAPIVRVSSLTGPFEVIDSGKDLMVVDGKTLSHYYFACQVSSRGTDL